MNIINSFLEKLYTDESMFPMDNYATDESEDDEKKILIPEQKNSFDKKRIMIDDPVKKAEHNKIAMILLGFAALCLFTFSL